MYGNEQVGAAPQLPAMTGRLWQAVHWLRRGLADYNPSSANPSDVGANNAYHDPPPRVVARGPAKAPFRQEANKSNRCQHRAGAVLRASPGVARLGGNVPAWLYAVVKVR